MIPSNFSPLHFPNEIQLLYIFSELTWFQLIALKKHANRCCVNTFQVVDIECSSFILLLLLQTEMFQCRGPPSIFFTV